MTHVVFRKRWKLPSVVFTALTLEPRMTYGALIDLMQSATTILSGSNPDMMSLVTNDDFIAGWYSGDDNQRGKVF